MSGPRKIIDLDGVPLHKWRLENGAMHVFKGRSWSKEPVGCILCIEEKGPEHSTLSYEDASGKEQFLCMTHGDLEEVPYSSVKTYTFRIGNIVRENEVKLEDSMLFPRSMSAKERDELITSMMDEEEEAEQAAGAFPPVSDSDEDED